jgi:uncharacterized membrane protein YczE
MKRLASIGSWVKFLLGLQCIAFGTTCTASAGLGTSAVASLPYIVSIIISFSYGTTTFFFHLLMFIVTLLILRKRFPPLQFMQVPSLFVFAVLVDVNMSIVQRIVLTNYFEQLLMLLCGCLFLGLGIALQIRSNKIMLPADAAPVVISTELGLSYTLVKTSIDVLEVIIGAIISLLLLGKVVGIKEGTLICALIVGIIVKACMKLFDLVSALIKRKRETKRSTI